MISEAVRAALNDTNDACTLLRSAVRMREFEDCRFTEDELKEIIAEKRREYIRLLDVLYGVYQREHDEAEA
jgi:hypothetical protein